MLPGHVCHHCRANIGYFHELYDDLYVSDYGVSLGRGLVMAGHFGRHRSGYGMDAVWRGSLLPQRHLLMVSNHLDVVHFNQFYGYSKTNDIVFYTTAYYVYKLPNAGSQDWVPIHRRGGA